VGVLAKAWYDGKSTHQMPAMITQIEATLINGAFQPDEPLPLPNLSRVRLTVEPVIDSGDDPQAAWKSIQSRLQARPLHFGGQRYTRDELHERR
jgi:hypothetical protein